MSPGYYIRPQPEGPASSPLIIDRTPIVINRGPEASSIVRAVSETRSRPRSLTLYRVLNPFTRRTHDATIATETSRVHRHRNSTDAQRFSLNPAPRSGRPSSPPPPPVLTQRRTRSLSPFRRTTTMPPTSGQQGIVPLPPVLPPAEPPQPEQHEPRDHREFEPVDPGQANRESQTRHRSPRRYHRRGRPADIFDPQEQVMEPTRRTVESFEVVTNEPIRSRPARTGGDVRNSREYRDMRAIAERNYRAAEEAAQRCSTAEVRLQNLQRQLAEVTIRENRANEVADELRRELDRTRVELDLLRRDHRISSRERDLAQDQLALEARRHESERARARNQERDGDNRRETPRESSGSGNSGRRHRRPVVHDPARHRDSTPRTPDPRVSATSTTTRTANPPTPENLADAGTEAINIARAEAARRGGRSS